VCVCVCVGLTTKDDDENDENDDTRPLAHLDEQQLARLSRACDIMDRYDPEATQAYQAKTKWGHFREVISMLEVVVDHC
jgi:hypothetical protein